MEKKIYEAKYEYAFASLFKSHIQISVVDPAVESLKQKELVVYGIHNHCFIAVFCSLERLLFGMGNTMCKSLVLCDAQQ